MESSSARTRIDFLDYMRVFAFLSVLVGHKFAVPLEAVAIDPGVSAAMRTLAGFALVLCRGGLVGVVVFFLTSGYIITHVLQSETAGQFAIKRIFRIYPLYVFAVLAEGIAAGTWPPASTLLPRLLLLGDFFKTPYALEGVEWTLRIEIVFYAFMAMLKATGVLDPSRWLPAAFALVTLALFVLPPFPSFAGWSDGFTSLYFPFLLVGSLVYLGQHRLASPLQCVGAASLVVAGYLLLQPRLHPTWPYSYYVLYAVALFLLAWAMRDRLVAGNAIRWLSDLTFAVYLFHNWLWIHLEALAQRAGATGTAHQPMVLAMLLFACYASVVVVERNGIRLGKRLLAATQDRAGRLSQAGLPAAS